MSVSSTGVSNVSINRPGEPSPAYVKDAQRSVTRAYQTILDRDPEQGVLQSRSNSLASQYSYHYLDAEQYMLREIFKSPEFQNKRANQSTEATVKDLYQGIFNREPDKAGLQTWTKALKSGESFENVMNSLFLSKEYHQSWAKDRFTPSTPGSVADFAA